MISHWLTEIQYGKFDEIEVPGQYTEVCASAHRLGPVHGLNVGPDAGHEPKLRADTEVPLQVRERALSRVLLEAPDDHRPR